MSLRKMWVAAAFACSLPAQSAVIDGNGLRDELLFARESEKAALDQVSYRSGRINGYFIGVHDALEGLGLFCPPPTEGIPAMSAVVFKYIEANPARLTQPANVVIVEALKAAFPCKTGRAGKAGLK
ncbi:MAG: hypothetical protein EXR27_18220 [Betaproteobacteria bacterium]|nr:hypothetical protein [Betaproteobacteria bacterium]